MYGGIPPLALGLGSGYREASRGTRTNWAEVLVVAVLNAQQPQDLDEVSQILCWLGVECIQGQD